MSIGFPEMIVIVMIFAPVVAIGVLCYIWMKNSRASQARTSSTTSRCSTCYASRTIC